MCPLQSLLQNQIQITQLTTTIFELFTWSDYPFLSTVDGVRFFQYHSNWVITREIILTNGLMQIRCVFLTYTIYWGAVTSTKSFSKLCGLWTSVNPTLFLILSISLALDFTQKNLLKHLLYQIMALRKWADCLYDDTHKMACFMWLSALWKWEHIIFCVIWGNGKQNILWGRPQANEPWFVHLKSAGSERSEKTKTENKTFFYL